MILGAVDEAVERGACQNAACKTVGISLRALQRWRTKGIGDDNRAGPKTRPYTATFDVSGSHSSCTSS